jgi:transposase
MDEAREIPTDTESLKQLVIEQRGTIKAKDFEIEHLRLQVARLRRMKFGQSSERFIGDVQQLALLNGEAAVSSPVNRTLASAEPELKATRKQPVRDVLPEHLPRESVVHVSPCQCPSCGGKLRKIGKRLSVTVLKIAHRVRLRDIDVAADFISADMAGESCRSYDHPSYGEARDVN